ncbi:MAG TPA: CoA pyrophosphatase [Rhodospirillales bacterium]|nr:CoA pyrophosphatase [Rhodospirillales bacterium]
MIAQLDRSWIGERFAGRRSIPIEPPLPADVACEHGDHALNEDMQPELPLKPAAVLVPLIERPDELTVLFTQRTSHLAHHAGQVSFPGGHIEAEDGGPAETALRETEEEVGLDRRHVDLIGRLDTYITRTGFVVTPVVGIVSPPFVLRPDPHEVAEIFEVPLHFLLDRRNHQRCSAEFEGKTRFFWAMPYGRHFIWGATAGMLINLCQILDGR